MMCCLCLPVIKADLNVVLVPAGLHFQHEHLQPYKWKVYQAGGNSSRLFMIRLITPEQEIPCPQE
jgi:hypothetical protein